MTDVEGEAESQRFCAELALTGRASAAANLDGASPLSWPPTAERIRQARLDAGLTDTEVARRLNMTLHSYWDLEHHDDEAFKVASLRNLSELGRILNVEPRVLLLGAEAERITQVITFSEIATRLAERVAGEQKTAEQLGDGIGWDVRPVLVDPQAFAGYDVEALFNICKTLGLDWVAALPSLVTQQT
jgi:transcriptional regulator with XRE-family HTH domain